MKALVFVLLSCLIASAQQDLWPSILKGNNLAQVTKLNETQTLSSTHSYRTRFYTFISDSEIQINDIRRFATTAESVPYALKRIPLNLVHLPRFDPGKNTHKIYIYADINAYDKAVGVKFSAGYYSKSKRAIFLRKDQFITAKKPNNQLLVHELTHLNMHGIIRYSNAWFSEGNAEYMASSLFDNGSYNFTTINKNIRNRALSFIQTKQDKITLPKLKLILPLSDPEWIKYNNNLDPKERYLPYLTALITVHYFYHLEPNGNGREKITQYIKDLTSGDKHLRATANQNLFKNTNLDHLEKTLTTYWKKHGLRIKFKELNN